MMTRGYLLLAAVVAAGPGCFGPDIPEVTCGPDDACPDGRFCDFDNVCRTVTPPNGGLIDRSLVVRYFMDEADTGTVPMQLVDSAPQPLNVDIIYELDIQFDERGGNRGLRVRPVDGVGRTTIPLRSTKLFNAIDGATEATLEVVLEIDAQASDSRIVSLGADAGSPFQLRLDNENLRLKLDGFDREWNPELSGRGRTVLHVVIDLRRADMNERALLFVDSIPEAPIDDTFESTQVFTLSQDATFNLTNRESGQRSMNGMLHYVAIYGAALTANEIRTNMTRLIASDDSD